MSHIHVPDGVLPIGWWSAAYLLTGVLLAFAIKSLENRDLKDKIPYLGVISAIMLITMSIPLGIVPFHLNLTVLMGILAGPALGFISVFIVNLILSFIGHGGITAVGLNTLILGLEVILGFFLFRFLKRWIKIIHAIGVATVITLVTSTIIMMAVVSLSQTGWEYALPHEYNFNGHYLGEEDLHHVYDGVNEGLSSEHLENEDLSSGNQSKGTDSISNQLEHGFKTMVSGVSFLGITGLGALIAILIVGIGLEILVTVLLTRFFLKVRADLIK